VGNISNTSNYTSCYTFSVMIEQHSRIYKNREIVMFFVLFETGEHGSDKLYEFTRQKHIWGSRVRQLNVTLQQMPDIKQNLIRGNFI